MSEKVCEVKNLTYMYPKSDKGVKNVSLYVNKGSIVGLLGESGCGKSTLAKCISSQLKADSGEIICQKIGYVFQDNYASLNPSKRVGWLLKETLSGGQRQRIGIAMALLSNPDILIADEPVSALDVTVQKQVIKLIKKLNESKNLAILFISHDIKVVREICNYIYIIKDGEVVEEGDSEDLFTHPSTEYTKNLLDSSYLENINV